MGVDTFEAREGWVPANTEGSVWCYRTRGNAGVLAFRRTEDGQSLYEATHQDCYASDETITTTRRVDAVRFAVTGAGAGAGAGAGDGAPDGLAVPPAGSTDAQPSPATPDASPPPAPGARVDAMRSAWGRYIDATSDFLEHVKANLDDTTHGDLLGRIDQALALVRDGAWKTRDAEQAQHDHPHEQPDALSATLGAALRRAHELIAERVQG